MKKLILNSLAAVALMAMAGCSSEDAPMPEGSGEPIVMSIGVDLGGTSRAIADGSMMTRLRWVIFDKDGNVQGQGNKDDAFSSSNLHTSVDLTLLDGAEYTVAFLADNENNSPFSIDESGIVTVNHALMFTGYDGSDGFYNTVKFIASSTSGSQAVSLSRLTAQINIWVDDYNNYKDDIYPVYGFNDVEGLYTKMNMYDGICSDISPNAVSYRRYRDAQAAEGSENPITRVYNGVTYTYMGYVYALAPTEGNLINFTGYIFDRTLNPDGSLKPLASNDFYNIPIKRNHRTNIFTGMTQNPNFRVTVEGNMADDDVNYPAFDATENAYLIHNLQELAGFDNMVTQGTHFENETVKLMADIDLAGVDWTPIGGITAGSLGGKSFNGTFDGNGHTIYNLTMALDYPSPRYYGFFGTISYDPYNGVPATIKNVTFENAAVRAFDQDEQFDGNQYGVVAGMAYGTVTFDNVHVNNSYVKAYGKVGGILGMNGDPGGLTTFNNCSVTNTVVYGVYNCGGFAGYIQNECKITGTASIEGTRWQRDAYCDRNGNYEDVDVQDITPDVGTIQHDVKGTYFKVDYGSVVYAYCAWGDYYTYPIWGYNSSGVLETNGYLYYTDGNGKPYYAVDFPMNNIPQDGDYYWDPATKP